MMKTSKVSKEIICTKPQLVKYLIVILGFVYVFEYISP